MKILRSIVLFFLFSPIHAHEAVVWSSDNHDDTLLRMVQSGQPVSNIISFINSVSSDPFNYEQNLYHAVSQAVYYGHENLLDALATRLPLHVTTNNGNTLLHYAASGNQPNIIKKLIKSYKLDSNSSDLQGNAAIHFAAVSGATETLAALDTCNTNFSMRNRNGENALLIACRLGHLKMVKALVDTYRINILCHDNYGNNALHHAASAHPPISDSVVSFLFSKNISFLLKNHKGETALHCAILEGNLAIINTLIRCNKRLRNIRNDNGALPALYAAAVGNIQAYDQVSYPRKKESEVDKNKKGALHYAAHYAQTDMLYHLLANPGFDINKMGKDGRRPIEEALASKSVAAVNILLNNSSYTSKDITDLLYFTCKHSNVENLINLLEKNHYVLPQHHGSGLDLLDVALKYHKNDMVSCLRQLPTCNTTHLLHRATKHKNFQIIQQLIENEHYPINTLDGDGLTPFAISLQLNDLELCKYLYNAGADVSYVTPSRDTILHCAIKTQNHELVKWLYSIGQFGRLHHIQQNNNGLTPVECANERNIPLLEILGAYIWQLNNKQCSYCHDQKYIHEVTLYKKCAHILCNQCDAVSVNNHHCLACSQLHN